LQMLAKVIVAALTAVTTTSCMGHVPFCPLPTLPRKGEGAKVKNNRTRTL